MNHLFRFAQPADAEAFAEWATSNPDIPLKDVEAAMRVNNPTSTTPVIEIDGQPILYVPVYCTLRVAYLGFNERASERQCITAMNLMLPALKIFAAHYGINEIDCLTKTGYPVARWAEKHGFNVEDRQLYTVKVK